jgi:protein phosphatase PTC2/3
MADLNSKPELDSQKSGIPRWQSLGNMLGPLSVDISPKNNPLSSRARNRHESQPIFPIELRPSTTRHNLKGFFPDPTKCSMKDNGIVKGYAACTNQGLVRNYNEDRVSIILNITQPPRKSGETWPTCSFFGVFDGHGGSACADFLRDNLHQYIVRTRFFPFQPKEAILEGFETAEKEFLEKAEKTSPVDKSGSCAIVAMIVGDICYIANLGDSRAVMSSDAGSKIYPLSRDHKPFVEEELKRIISNGGKIYQSVGQVNANPVLGPYRVFPGRLSVSRTIGDIEAKSPTYGGNNKVLISAPDIKAFKIHPQYEFIVLASDGIFDKLSNKEVVQSAWAGLMENMTDSIHQLCGASVENIMRTALCRRSLDNITAVIIAFDGMINKISQIKSIN